MSSPRAIRAVLQEQLAFIDEQERTLSEIEAAFREITDVIDENVVAVEALTPTSTSHAALARLEELRATVYALRVRYVPQADRERVWRAPRTLALWQVALLVYGRVDAIDKLYKANSIPDPLAVPEGTLLRLLPKD